MSVNLTYELKQETPMIHFQHYDDGATLRATELKPKLDKFLRKKYKNEIKNEWKIDPDHDALNYKVAIKANGNPEKSDTIGAEIENAEKRRYGDVVRKNHQKINSMYFGNMVTHPKLDKCSDDEFYDYLDEVEDSFKESVRYQNPIELDIICFIPDLRDLIEKSIVEFFMTTNFGTRQSKGFGGFTVYKQLKPKEKFIDIVPEKLLAEKGYKFFYVDNQNEKNINELMNKAVCVYSAMKGGVHPVENGKTIAYIKGYIQRQYFEDIGKPDVGSEKKLIKSKLLFGNNKGKKYDEHQFSRAILGVPEKYDYKQERKTIVVKSNEVDRFQSTVTIKIIKGKIFFIFNDNYRSILGKKFTLSEKKGYQKEQITVPEEFDVDQFIECFIKYYEEEKKKKEPDLKKIQNPPYKYVLSVSLKNGKDVVI